MRREKTLMLAELGKTIRRKLAEATLTDLALSEDVLEASRSRREILSELSAHSQKVIFVRLTNWVINASTEVAKQPKVQDSRVEKQTRSVSLTGVRSNISAEILRPNTIPASFSVPNLTNLNQSSMNNAQYSVQSNATQPQPVPINFDPV